MNQSQIACETQSAILAVFKEHFKHMLGEDSGNHIYATKADTLVCENVIPAEDDAGERVEDGDDAAPPPAAADVELDDVFSFPSL